MYQRVVASMPSYQRGLILDNSLFVSSNLIDLFFVVIQQMEMNTLRDMMLGKPAPLLSTFRLSYYTILNLLSRAEGQFTAEHVIRHSFHQFQYEKVAVEFLFPNFNYTFLMLIYITLFFMLIYVAVPTSGFTRY